MDDDVLGSDFLGSCEINWKDLQRQVLLGPSIGLIGTIITMTPKHTHDDTTTLMLVHNTHVYTPLTPYTTQPQHTAPHITTPQYTAHHNATQARTHHTIPKQHTHTYTTQNTSSHSLMAAQRCGAIPHETGQGGVWVPSLEWCVHHQPRRSKENLRCVYNAKTRSQWRTQADGMVDDDG